MRATIIATLLAALATPFQAAGAAGQVAVSAVITGTGHCLVKGTSDIAFGTLNPLNPLDVQATGSVSLQCNGIGAGITVAVTQVTPSPLALKSGTNVIPYDLELPASASVASGPVVRFDIPIKADIQGMNYRYAPAGSYTDTVTLQITP